MEYTSRDELIMPEYGRNIQQMVDIAVHIPDRAERTRCARTIIDIMGNMFPYLRDVENFKFKLWDHLAIMSKFQLDIDYPCEVVHPDNTRMRPEPIPYQPSPMRYLHYGRIIQQFIKHATTLEDSPYKDKLLHLLANHMKKSFLTWNRDNIDDQTILDDICNMSDGCIRLSANTFKLMESRDIIANRRQFNNSKKGGKRKG